MQTTVSRDVHELGLVKVRAPSGGSSTRRPGTDDADRRARDRRRDAPLRDRRRASRARSSSSRRRPGTRARSRRRSTRARTPGIAGTIAGDNTIFLAPREGTTAAALGDELREHLVKG